MALVDLIRQDLAGAKTQEANIPDFRCKMLLGLGETQNIPLSDQDFSYTPASLFGASSDTTASTLCFAFLTLITHPETPKTAQAILALRLRIFPFRHLPMRFAPYSYNAF